MTGTTRGFVCQKGKVEDWYDLKEELGRGQFAVVKRCVSKETQEQVAAKFIKLKRTKTSRAGLSREVIEREAELLACVDHGNIIQLHNVFDIGSEMVLILELLSGGELFDKICDMEYMTEMDACGYLKQVLEALDYLHEKSIVHLDIKPENIVLKSKDDAAVKIVDFGLAQRLVEGQQLKEMMGTPEFVAPEIINFDTIGTYTDMWAVGVLTYVLLSGYSPFLGDNNQETYANIVQMNYDFDDEYFDTICDEAKEFVTSLLTMNPRKRNTAKDCLSHSWLVRMTQPRERIESRSVINTAGFKTFVARRRWKSTLNKLSAISMFARAISAKPKTPIPEGDDGAKPKSSAHDTPVDQVATSSPDDSVDTKKVEENQNISQEDTDDQSEQHTSKVAVVLRRPLSAHFSPDEKKRKTEENSQGDEYIHFDAEVEKVDPCDPIEHIEPSIVDDATITKDDDTNKSEVLEESTYIHADESCTLEIDDSHDKSHLPETVNDATVDSDFYVVDVVNNEGNQNEAAPAHEAIIETVVITDAQDEEQPPDIVPNEETHETVASLVNESMVVDVQMTDDESPLDTSEVGMHTVETGDTLGNKDSTDLLKDQIFGLISNIDHTENAKKTSTSSIESGNEKTVTDDDVRKITSESTDPDSVNIDLSMSIDNKPGTENNDISHCTENNSIDSNSMSNELDNINPFQNNVNLSADLVLPHINISITSRQAEDGDDYKTQENAINKAHYRYSRESPVRYTEILKEDSVEIADEEKSHNLVVSSECLHDKSYENQGLHATLEPEKSLIDGESGGDNMSESIKLDISVDADQELTKDDSTPVEDACNLSEVVNSDDVSVEGSVDGTPSKECSRTERKHAVHTDHKDMINSDTKRSSRTLSLNEQRRQFILGENRAQSVDTKANVSQDEIKEDATVTRDETSVLEDIIIPSVEADVKEQPDDITESSPEEEIATITTETDTVDQNGKLVSEIPGVTPEQEQTIECNEQVEPEPGLDINKNPGGDTDINDKKDKLPNDTEIQNGNSDNIAEDEPEKTKKKKKKGKQTCKCSLM